MTSPVFGYVLTKQDFVNAQRLYRKRNVRATLSYYFLIWLVPALSICPTLLAAWAYYDGNLANFPNLAAIAGAGLWLAVFIPLRRYYSIHKLWKQTVEMTEGKPVQLQFDEEQIVSSVPGKNEGRFLWGSIFEYAEDDQIALVFVQKKNFLYIPKSALPDAAWEQLRRYTTKV